MFVGRARELEVPAPADVSDPGADKDQRMDLDQLARLLPPPSEQMKVLPPLIVAGVIGLFGVRRVPAIGAGTGLLGRLSHAAGALAVAASGLAASAAVVGFATLPPTGATQRVGLLLLALLVIGPVIALLSRAWARWSMTALLLVCVPLAVHGGRLGEAIKDPGALGRLLGISAVVLAGGLAIVGALWTLERRGRTVTSAIVMGGLAQAVGLVLVFAGTASVGQISAGLGVGMLGLAGVLGIYRSRPSRTPAEGLWGADPGATLGLGAIGVYAASFAALVCQTAGWSGSGVRPWQLLGFIAVPWTSVVCDLLLGQRVRDPWGMLIRVGAAATVAVGVLVLSIPEDLSGY